MTDVIVRGRDGIPIPSYGSSTQVPAAENDLPYFIVAQTKVIRQAIEELRACVNRKTVMEKEARNA